jgi:hypothetical protein
MAAHPEQSTTSRVAYSGFVLELHRRLVAAQVATSFECASVGAGTR